jgi:hypothetical protein
MTFEFGIAVEPLFDLLSLGMVGEKLEEIVEVIVGEASRFENRHWSPCDRGGEVAGLESVDRLVRSCD